MQSWQVCFYVDVVKDVVKGTGDVVKGKIKGNVLKLV